MYVFKRSNVEDTFYVNLIAKHKLRIDPWGADGA